MNSREIIKRCIEFSGPERIGFDFVGPHPSPCPVSDSRGIVQENIFPLWGVVRVWSLFISPPPLFCGKQRVPWEKFPCLQPTVEIYLRHGRP